MNRRNKICFLCVILVGSIAITGCTNRNNKMSDVEKVVYTILPPDEVVSIKEEPSKKKVDEKVLNDVEIILNLERTSKTIAYEKSLETVTALLSNIDTALENTINDYTFKVNSTELDIYGIEQKVKVVEIKIDKDTVDKINFDNFDYLNLDKISKVTKFKYLTAEKKDN